MLALKGLVAYPSDLKVVSETICSTINQLKENNPELALSPWEENDVAGRFIHSSVLEKIDAGNLLIADITRLNFNVTFEIGYCIGKRKRAFLIRNQAVSKETAKIEDVGIYDTLGYKGYSNSEDLSAIIREISDLSPLRIEDYQLGTIAPVYVLLPRIKGDAEIKIISRIKKARLKFRSFDPEEQSRLSAREAIANVMFSHGIVIPLLSKEHVDAPVHNLRAAFVAGLSFALDKVLLLLQAQGSLVPLDYRDFVHEYLNVGQIDGHIGEFAPAITERLQPEITAGIPKPQTFLARLNLGASFAENEMDGLKEYFLETHDYQRTFRGEVQVVTGRKGVGKTAMFAQVRDKLRQNRKNIILDLRPQGYQLLKFRDLILGMLKQGTKEHTITAFWTYLLYLEICYKLLEKDKERHIHDQRLYEPYQKLSGSYQSDEFISEGDFAERMLKLIQRITEDFTAFLGQKKQESLTAAEITGLLYKHDIFKLQEELVDYLKYKDGLWILFDNLDKGWPSYGLTSDDVVIIKCLLDALLKLEHSLKKRGIPCKGIIFIRNDVYEHLVDMTPDRGKTSFITIDWTEPDMLRELLRRRFALGDDLNDVSQNVEFQKIWAQICTSHISGEESSQYLIDRCLMRPRALIELIQHCRSHAVNLSKTKLDLDDIQYGEEKYSTDLVRDISYEIRDILPEAENVLYELIESKVFINHTDLIKLFGEKIKKSNPDKIAELLLWYGVLGLKRDDGEVTYIYSVKYDMKHLKSLVKKRKDPMYYINPAFWKGLEIKSV